MKYDVDTCIYVNLWNKEERAGRQFWRFAKDFFEKTPREGVLFSGFILKELENVLGVRFTFEMRRTIEGHLRIIAHDDDYAAARVLEREVRFEIGFFDCMHIILTRRTDAVLVTRDRLLIKCATGRCAVARPEEL
jgi:hypothetical protein